MSVCLSVCLCVYLDTVIVEQYLEVVVVVAAVVLELTFRRHNKMAADWHFVFAFLRSTLLRHRRMSVQFVGFACPPVIVLGFIRNAPRI